MVNPLQQREMSLSIAKPEIASGDLLLFRGKGAISTTIKRLTRSEYSHAAKASWAKGVIECCEVRELVGGRIVTLRSQVALYPGQIDVFKVNADGLPEVSLENAAANSLAKGKFYDRDGADRMMRSFAGTEYGYWTVFKASLSHLPFIRLLTPPNYDDLHTATIPDCSAACAIADRLGGGYDPVRHLSDTDTTPGDLAKSPFYEYMMTLIP